MKATYCTEAHRWIPAAAGPFPWRCRLCPGVAADCHECRGLPLASVRCERCGGTGKLEMIELSQQELDRLRLADRRFEWLLQFWALATGAKVTEASDFIDGRLARDESPRQAAQLAGLTVPGNRHRGRGQSAGKRG